MLLTASPLFFFFWGASESGPYRGTVDLITVVTPELALWASEVYTLFQGSLLRSERPLHIYFSTPLSLQPSPFFHLCIPWPIWLGAQRPRGTSLAGLFLDDWKEVTVVYFVDWVLISFITHTID